MKLFSAILPLCIASVAHAASVQVVFSDSGQGAATQLQIINAATQSIHVAMFEFTDVRYFTALTNAQARGVDVRLIADKSESITPGSKVPALLAALGTNRVQVIGGWRPGHIMHEKVVIVDGFIVILGSFNWTKAADQGNYEVFMVHHSRALAKLFEAEFMKLENQTAKSVSDMQSSEPKPAKTSLLHTCCLWDVVGCLFVWYELY